MNPRIRHIAALWTLVGHPSPKKEWSLERKIRAVKEAGFDGFTTAGSPEVGRLAKKYDLIFVGAFSSSKASEFRKLLKEQKDAGAEHVNVQLGDEDTLTPEALKLTLALMAEAERIGVTAYIEIHRNTCTETPEKAYALADAYYRKTRKLLPMTPDYSHIAVVKHLAPPYASRLLTHPKILQRTQLIHCRPFNGHHCQVPVTDGKGRLTPELKDYLEFVEEMFRVWIRGNKSGTDLYVVPEMGPVQGGYNLSTLPGSWEDALILRDLLDKAFRKALRDTAKK